MNMRNEFPEESPSDAPLEETHASPVTVSAVTISPLTVLRFLIGNRQAILDIARSRHTIWLGAILVLSAGFAREYDGEDLLREPWHLFIPHAASLVTCFILYCMVRLVALRRKAALPKFIPGFGIFLGLFWMTAPLAWVYAIPFERWADPGYATQLNLLLLGLVAIWRVILIIRVIQVAFGAATTFHIEMTVGLFGNAVMLTALRFVPVPILQIMGGVRLTDTESVMQSTVVLLTIVGTLALPILLVGYALAFRKLPQWEPVVIEPTGKISVSTWIAAALTVLIWGAVLPITQPEQQLRWQVEHDLKAGRIAEALRIMSNHERSAFPPHWDPPPHVALQRHSPHIADVIAAVVTENPAYWVRQPYIEKFQRKFANIFSPYSSASALERSRYLVVMRGLPLETWYPKFEWDADQFRSILETLASDDEAAVGPEIRKLAQEALSRLPDKPAPDILQPQDDHEKVPEADPATAAGDQLLRELQPRIVESP
jgi:hypothetical protein